jgi:hypothetical protein
MGSHPTLVMTHTHIAHNLSPFLLTCCFELQNVKVAYYL